MLAPFVLIPDTKSIRWLIYAFENILNSFVCFLIYFLKFFKYFLGSTSTFYY